MKKPIKSTNNSELLKSLKNLSLCLKDKGSILETHVLLSNYWAVAHNGIIGAGEKILEDLYCCPNVELLTAALSKCTSTISISQLEQTLAVKSDKFRAVVPCIPPENMQRVSPDASLAPVSDRLKASLMAVAPLALDENAVVTASVLLQDATVIATDRKVMIQHFHGCDMPTLALPKAIIGPLTKNTKPLKSFGFSNSSITFYYEDDSWFKSQMFAEQWPDIRTVLDKPSNPWTLPDDFYMAVKALEPFSEDGYVYFSDNKMLSHAEEAQGASYEVYGLPKGPVFSIKQLKMVEPFMKKVDFMAGENKSLMFYSEAARGAIAGRV